MNTPTGLFPELWTPPTKLPRSLGAGYRGSKSRIAKKLFAAMEDYYGGSFTGKTFLDPFAGGLAMSHYAVVAKGMKAVASDASKVHVDLLRAVIFDGYTQTDEFWEWVSNDTFTNHRDSLSYLKRASLASIWSFNNFEGAYCYSKAKEPLAREAHNMIVFGVEPDYSILPIGREGYERIMAIPGDKVMGFQKRRGEFKKVIKELLSESEVLSAIWLQNVRQGEPYARLDRVRRIHHQERSERLTSLPLLELECKDYRDALSSIPKGAIVYLDPPYEDTLGYTNGDKATDGSNFNHSEFWALAEELAKAGHAVFVSSYEAPVGWRSVFEKSLKHIANNSLNVSELTMKKKVVEKLFVYEG